MKRKILSAIAVLLFIGAFAMTSTNTDKKCCIKKQSCCYKGSACCAK